MMRVASELLNVGRHMTVVRNEAHGRCERFVCDTSGVQTNASRQTASELFDGTTAAVSFAWQCFVCTGARV